MAKLRHIMSPTREICRRCRKTRKAIYNTPPDAKGKCFRCRPRFPYRRLLKP